MNISQYNIYCHNNLLKYINIDEIDYVLELGCYDGSYTKEINEIYKPRKIYSVDANPLNLEIIKNNQKNIPNLEFFNQALWHKETELHFNVFDIHGDLGSSSFFSLPNRKPDNVLKLETKTLDNFLSDNNIKKIDCILADVEGAEANIFRNQKILSRVKYIICEAKIEKGWKGDDFPDIKDVENSLKPFGFEAVEYSFPYHRAFADILWINSKL